MAEPKNTEYRLELILREPVGFEGEVTFEGMTDNPVLALAAYTSLEVLRTPWSNRRHTINIYKNDKVITLDELTEDHLIYSGLKNPQSP